MPSGVYIKTEEHRKNISKALTGIVRTKETIKRMSEAKKRMTEETKNKMRKPKSEEHKRNISLSHKRRRAG